MEERIPKILELVFAAYLPERKWQTYVNSQKFTKKNKPAFFTPYNILTAWYTSCLHHSNLIFPYSNASGTVILKWNQYNFFQEVIHIKEGK